MAWSRSICRMTLCPKQTYSESFRPAWRIFVHMIPPFLKQRLHPRLRKSVLKNNFLGYLESEADNCLCPVYVCVCSLNALKSELYFIFNVLIKSAWFQASALVQMTSALFWDFTYLRLIIQYGRFKTMYRPHLLRSSNPVKRATWPTKMGPMGCPKRQYVSTNLCWIRSQKNADLVHISQETFFVSIKRPVS
jgi:hypothetical protein